MVWRSFAILALAVAVPAQARDSGRQWITLASGESREVFGATYTAAAATKAVLSLSSELVTAAVVEGVLSSGSTSARAGEALVIPLDGGKTRRFKFDAHRLAATLPPDWAAQADEPLREIAAQQRRQRFWGMLEPVNLNASAPVRPELEQVRQSYLGNDTIAALRRAAGGDPRKLASLTAKQFAVALARRDAAAVADLIDPKPFTDTGAYAAEWQHARHAFAGTLVADAALAKSMAAEPLPVPDDQTAFDADGYRIRLMPRDRAIFVVSVEKL